MIGVVTRMVRHAGSGQIAARRNEAVDLTLRLFLPADVERAELREKLQLAVGEVIVDPPRHRLPLGAFQQAIGKPRDDDAGHGPDAPSRIAAVPDMAPIVALVRSAVVVVRVAKRVYRGRPVSRTDRQPSECRLQRFEEFLAEVPTRRNRQIRIGRDVRNAVEARDIAVKKVAHEKRARQPHSTKLFQSAHSPWCPHRRCTRYYLGFNIIRRF